MPNIVTLWNELLLEAIRQVKPGPPIAARSIALVYTSIYDAWAAYDPVAKPTVMGIAQRPALENTVANKETAIHYAAFRALSDQFPLVKQLFADKMTALGLNAADASIELTTPVGVGNTASRLVLDSRQEDGANESGNYADTTWYIPVNPPLNPLFASSVEDIPFPDKWQPLVYLNADLRPSTPSYITPHWGNVRPFALASGNEFRPAHPQPLASQGFLDQAKHLIEVQANLTPEQKVIAEYWADGPRSELPPGHWTIFTSFVAERDRLSLDDSVKLFFAVTNAVFDASIAAWDAKKAYNYTRPITAIRHLFRGKTIRAWGGAGKGTIEIKGESWHTFQINTFPTPPFPEYVSGHSTFSMAAAEVLRSFTHSDKFGYFYLQTKPLAADPSENVIGIAMKWDTFTQAALDAGESRLYGGIHFYEGNVAGLELGRKVGKKAFLKAQQYWTGAI